MDGAALHPGDQRGGHLPPPPRRRHPSHSPQGYQQTIHHNIVLAIVLRDISKLYNHYIVLAIVLRDISKPLQLLHSPSHSPQGYQQTLLALWDTFGRAYKNYCLRDMSPNFLLPPQPLRDNKDILRHAEHF